MSRDIPTEKSIESKQMVLPLLPGIPLQTLTQQYLNANGQTFNEDWLMKRNQQSKYPSIVETSPESKGYRLVAADLLPAGTIVERFEGPDVEYANCSDYDKRYVLIYHNSADPLNVWRYLLPMTASRYANHACEPNCIVDDNLNIVTVTQVPAGGELTYIYNCGSELEDPWDPIWTFQCRCGASSCQGLIDRYRQVKVPQLPPDLASKIQPKNKSI